VAQPNNGMQLTRPVQVAASQLIPSVGPTRRGRGGAMGCQDRSDGHNK